MDAEKEEARPGPDLESLPQERHVWRIPEFPPITKGLNHFQVEAMEIYWYQYRKWYRAAKEEEWEICPSLWQGAMNSYLKINSWLKNQILLSIDQKEGLERTPALDKEGPVSSTSSKPALEVLKEDPKGHQKKKRGPQTNQGKGKRKANQHRPYPQRYRIPKLEPSAVDSVLNMARNLMEFIA
ncbi:hypothetical protein O181_015487 [Austropuccinia psidii MF-1]|uniref:Uncharacterized protein n=1 Tax=Austropuccinia psidii MF-1 TaxID=1389203 RepID=A0A9Q3C3S7_9BASI|nr:hypothetical protein [Austropuccinia psidii MF-1]